MNFGGFFCTTSTRFIEHKKVRIAQVAICLRLNAKFTGLMANSNVAKKMPRHDSQD